MTREARDGTVVAMRTWTATTTAKAHPEAVLEVLTDPDAAARWAPLPFDVDELDGERLLAGSRARVSGKLADAASASIWTSARPTRPASRSARAARSRSMSPTSCRTPPA